MPRPLNFIRVRLYRGGQAEFMEELLLGVKDDMMAELGDLRGRDPDSPEIQKLERELRWLISALGDVQMGLVELAGPDGW